VISNRLVALIWRALASGNAIDEQSAALQSKPRASSAKTGTEQPATGAATDPTPPPEWDDDRDPNDIVPAQPTTRTGPVPSDPYDDWDNEEYEAF
jgi:hypothetical protein